MKSFDSAIAPPFSHSLYTSLDKSSLELKMIMDSSVDVICTIDGTGCFLKVGTASLKMWGYEPEELIGMQSLDLVYKKDLAVTKQNFSRIKKGVEMTNFENRFCCKDGSVIPLIWSARWNEEHQIM